MNRGAPLNIAGEVPLSTSQPDCYALSGYVEMERLQCKACGCYSMVPMEVAVDGEEEEQEILGDEHESRFYSCHVCGDNWLSVKENRGETECRVTFIHQMGMQPTLKRVANMETSVLLKEETVDEWTYFLDDEQVAEHRWRTKLDNRRRILKSICTN
jgi:hypothetical protein